MLILDRPDQSGLPVIICLSFIIFCLFAFLLVCVVCLNRRIPAGSRGTIERLPIWLINQPLDVFFPCNDLSCEYLPYQRGKYLVRFNALCYRFVSSLGGYHYLGNAFKDESFLFMPNASREQSHLSSNQGTRGSYAPQHIPKSVCQETQSGAAGLELKGINYRVGRCSYGSCEWESTSGCVLMQPGYYYCYSVRHGYGARTYRVRAQAKSQSILLPHRSAIHFGPGYRSPV